MVKGGFYRFGMTGEGVDLSCIANTVEDMGVREEMDGRSVMRLNLILEELALNVKNHGVVNGRCLDVRADFSEAGVLRVLFVDDGVEFDPTVVEEPDLAVDVEARRVGGLGIHLVKTLVDRWRYERVGGENRLSFEMSI